MRRVILAICATAAGLVLLLSFKSHTQSAAPAADLGPSPGTGTSGITGSAAPQGTGAAMTFTGAAWPTVYGPVQVRVTVKAGKLTAVTAVEYPTATPRDNQINSYAIPELNSEALAAGSAKIDTVSGATYTSRGYAGSLQSALDKAGIS